MEWLEKMNGALDYIEAHLTEEINPAKLAGVACCSSFNFQRMFSFMADVTLADYIRRRRLTRAAMELLSTREKVIDIALRYGYGSPVSFARAFRAVHGINPGDVRKPGVCIKSYPRITFTITIKGVEAMNYRIENFSEMRLVGYRERMNMENGENFRRIPQFWNECYSDDRGKTLMQYNDDKKLYCLGVCANDSDREFDYYIATGSSKKISVDMEELIVPAATYAVFECVGTMPDAMQAMWKRIFSEWFPTAKYEPANHAPQIEWYSEGDMQRDSYRSEIWIPILKKD
jgi:AraC family transcriptional regulator